MSVAASGWRATSCEIGYPNGLWLCLSGLAICTPDMTIWEQVVICLQVPIAFDHMSYTLFPMVNRLNKLTRCQIGLVFESVGLEMGSWPEWICFTLFAGFSKGRAWLFLFIGQRWFQSCLWTSPGIVWLQFPIAKLCSYKLALGLWIATYEPSQMYCWLHNGPFQTAISRMIPFNSRTFKTQALSLSIFAFVISGWVAQEGCS